MSFDAAQASTLLSIAEQCPLLGGNPVYQARSLYSLIDEEADFDDALLCAEAGYVVKSMEQPAPSIRAYPNPNRTGQLFFEVLGLDAAEQVLTAILYDVQGRPVAEQQINGPKGGMDVSRLAQGLYHWTVQLNDQRLGHGKVTIF